MDLLCAQLDDIVALEWRSSGEQRHQQTAKRVEVASGIGRSTEELLGGQVGGGPDDPDCRGDDGSGRRFDESSDPEIEHLDDIGVREDDIGGFDVPVHDARGVCCLQSRSDLVPY